MMKNTVDLFLDFFHSAFVTALWIYNNNNNISCENLTRNSYSSYTDMTCVLKTTKTKKKNNVTINEGNLEKNYFSSLNNHDNDKENENKTCTHKMGFCLSYYKDSDDIRNKIHNYGCQHLLEVMPTCLYYAIEEANNANQSDSFIDKINVEFKLFLLFLDTLKNIKNNEAEKENARINV